MSKKVISILLAAMLLIALSTTVFASPPFKDKFTVALEDESHEKEEKGNFTFEGKEYTDTWIATFPVGDKVIITAKINGIAVEHREEVAPGVVIPATLVSDDSFGPVAISEATLKEGESRSFTITESDVVRVIRVSSFSDNHYWDFFYKVVPAIEDTSSASSSSETSSSSEVTSSSEASSSEVSSSEPAVSSVAEVTSSQSADSSSASAVSETSAPPANETKGTLPIVPIVVCGAVAVVGVSGAAWYFTVKKKG